MRYQMEIGQHFSRSQRNGLWKVLPKSTKIGWRRQHMQNVIIVLIIALIIGYGIYATVMHFKGQGGCCGGGGYRPRKKRLKAILKQKKFHIQGMNCNNCKRRVEEAVNDLEGVAGRVNLKKGLLTVYYAKDIEDQVIQTKIERLGYRVMGIQ